MPQAQPDSGPAAAQPHQVVLPSHLLIAALNEHVSLSAVSRCAHGMPAWQCTRSSRSCRRRRPLRQLSERQAGNRAYQQQQHQAALHHYARALAVVDFVVAESPDDMAEVRHNKAATLLNTAAVHLALQDWGAAAAACSAALAADPQHSDDFAVKALLRRSSANTKRHEYRVRWPGVRALPLCQCRMSGRKLLPRCGSDTPVLTEPCACLRTHNRARRPRWTTWTRQRRGSLGMRTLRSCTRACWRRGGTHATPSTGGWPPRCWNSTEAAA